MERNAFHGLEENPRGCRSKYPTLERSQLQNAPVVIKAMKRRTALALRLIVHKILTKVKESEEGKEMRRIKKNYIFWFITLLMTTGIILAGCGAGAKKNVVVIGMLGDVETLNPILSENSSETEIMNGLFSTLIKMNDQLQMEPDLLTRMPVVSADRKTYTFQLRQGVKFHDGVEMTAADVEYLWKMNLAEGNLVPSREMWEAIKEFEIIDQYNFQITLKEADVTWLQGWCYGDGMIPPKHILEQEFAAGGNVLTKGGAFSRHPVGTGPYMLAEWKPDQYVMLKRNPNYFREGQPKLEKIIFKVIPDTNTMLAQFKKGELDVFNQAQANQYYELLKMKEEGREIDVHKYPAYTYLHADFNLRNPIFQDKRVRQALCYAFPKADFIRTVLDGVATPADSYIVPMSWAYKADVKKYDYNPAKAKQLLAEAGWLPGPDGVRVKDGQELTFRISTNTENRTRTKFQEIAKQAWEAVGARVEIQNYEGATLFGDILEKGKFDIIVFAWVSGEDPDGYTLWHSKQDPIAYGTGQNYVGYKNDRIDQLSVAGKKEFDREKRIRIYHEIQETLAEEVPYMFVYFYNNVVAIKSKIKNFKPNPTQANNTWNIYEWEI